MRKIRLGWLLLFSCLVLAAHAALIPSKYINTVVAIGHNVTDQGGQSRWVTDGTGFLYGYLVQNDPDPTKRRYEIYLITNRHVIENITEVNLRLNPKEASDPGKVFPLQLLDAQGNRTIFYHRDQNVDIAGARLNVQFLRDQGIEISFITSDTNSADVSKLRDIGVSAGDGIFVIGFPMNLAGPQRNYAIVRPGAIARVEDLLDSASSDLLIDSHVFPGNSGGPVILQPSIMAISGTKSNNRAYLIGVVKSYIAYVDIAISQRTGRPRVTFEDNSGLAEVVPVDRINEAIKAWRDSLPPSPQGSLRTSPDEPLRQPASGNP